MALSKEEFRERLKSFGEQLYSLGDEVVAWVVFELNATALNTSVVMAGKHNASDRGKVCNIFEDNFIFGELSYGLEFVQLDERSGQLRAAELQELIFAEPEKYLTLFRH